MPSNNASPSTRRLTADRSVALPGPKGWVLPGHRVYYLPSAFESVRLAAPDGPLTGRSASEASIRGSAWHPRARLVAGFRPQHSICTGRSAPPIAAGSWSLPPVESMTDALERRSPVPEPRPSARTQRVPPELEQPRRSPRLRGQLHGDPCRLELLQHGSDAAARTGDLSEPPLLDLGLRRVGQRVPPKSTPDPSGLRVVEPTDVSPGAKTNDRQLLVAERERGCQWSRKLRGWRLHRRLVADRARPCDEAALFDHVDSLRKTVWDLVCRVRPTVGSARLPLARRRQAGRRP